MALVAAKQWRALASAVVTIIVLTGCSIAAFGVGPWWAFPHALQMQADWMLLHKISGAPLWGSMQTVYGFSRTVHASSMVAWALQISATLGTFAIVWVIWRSSARYALKAALLSAATLVATPYAWAHDFSVIVIPVAFLAADQLRSQLLSGEPVIFAVLFGVGLAIVIRLGEVPFGPFIIAVLIGAILRRCMYDCERVRPFPAAS